MNCEVMGILNVTPDSFSDGGRYYEPEEAIRRGLKLVQEGASIIDIGGESTRPGAEPLDWQTEWNRIAPVVSPLAAALPLGVRLSVDTYHPETAERAMAAGARIINCVYPEPARAMVHRFTAPEIELVVPAALAADADLDLSRLYLDPMIGFGTTREEDLERLRNLGELARRGRVLVGASRKRIVKKLIGTKFAGKDLGGNLALALWAAAKGASAVRVHDVAETVQALKVWAAMKGDAA